ncbi:hypothetical protein NDU88_008275 [Pleurodeles waltl]|uniref:Uncharacterized protein n=1 Tax=Pleurodeles waltl TaxID=8319 RepID=A0AAV7U3Z5_PLEWA|nr:hypothetical protein NDU88_008275 [Pleurodeles waltl]
MGVPNGSPEKNKKVRSIHLRAEVTGLQRGHAGGDNTESCGFVRRICSPYMAQGGLQADPHTALRSAPRPRLMSSSSCHDQLCTDPNASAEKQHEAQHEAPDAL